MDKYSHSAPPRGARSRAAGSGLPTRPWWTWIQAVAALATVISAVLVPAAFVAHAASSTAYLGTDISNNIGFNATDPHGGIWLKGTVDGTTLGAMDTSTVAPVAGTLTGQAPAGTAPAGWSFGHLWETDVPSGFCRVDTVNDVNNPGATIQLYARPNAYAGAPSGGGCITNGQKSSQPILDPRRNADGTFWVYTCDWAVFSAGCYRMTYDPGAQQMKQSTQLAQGKFPNGGGRGIKPFSTNLAHDGNLYVTSDLTGYVYKITNPNQNNNTQTVSIVGSSNDGSRIRAATFACWDPFRGGTTGLPSCAQSKLNGDPAPDLVLTQKTSISVLMNVAGCAGVASDTNGLPVSTPACVGQHVHIQVLTPMGAQVQGGWNQIVDATGKPTWGPALDPNTIYISDSPGATTQIVRYTINTDTQDSFSNFGVFPDGTIEQYSFGFSPTQSPDGRMFLGDDPSAGASSGNGHIFMIPAGAPADVLGAPGAPATPPALPAQKTGQIYGSGVSLPNDGVWLPGALGGHYWISDGAAGFCRMDPNAAVGAAAPFALNSATCDITTTKPGQPVYDSAAQADGTHFVYLPDKSTRGQGVVRVKYNPTTETIVAGSGVSLQGPSGELTGQKNSGAALDPITGALYVGDLTRNTTSPSDIARILNPTSAAGPWTVEFVASTTRTKPVFNLAFIGPDLYVGDNGGLDLLSDANTCLPGGCTTTLILNTRGPRGMVGDGVSKIYMAGPSIPAGCPPTCPAPGSTTTSVQVYDITTGDFSTFSSQGTLADGVTLSAYEVVDSLGLDPAGNLYVADDPSVLGLPAGQGRVFKVLNVALEPMPAIVSKPSTFTNLNQPLFIYQSSDAQATFKCSLVKSGAADSFLNCPGTASGSVTYGTDTTGAIVQNGVNVVPDGGYVFKVEGIGATGTSVPNAYSFTVDTVAPPVTITTAAATPTNKNTPTYAFSSTDTTARFTCSLTPVATGADQFSVCASPLTYPAQADGAYTFKVTATDAAGNATTATAPLVIDTVAPTVAASPVGGSFTTAQSVVITATDAAPSSGNSTIYYTTDGTTPTTATLTKGPSPLTVNVASSATLKYIAVDPAGNSSTVGSQVYQIGSVLITSNPPALSNSNTATFAWSDTGATTFSCSLVLQSAVDSFAACGSATAATTGTTTYTGQLDGAYRFVVKDAGGSSASFLFTIDTTPPVVTITNNPANPDTSSSASFSFSATDASLPVTYQCSFGLSTAAPAFSACTSPTNYTGLADGTYTFQVKGTDKAGNTSGASTYTFGVAANAGPRTTAPVQTLTGMTTAQTGTSATTTNAGPITASSSGVPVTISWTGTACASGAVGCNIASYHLQESVNGLGFSDVTLPSPTATSVTLNLKPSPTNNSTPATTYKFQVQATDTSGNISTFAIAPSFIVPDTDNSFNSSFNGSWSGVNITGAFGGSVQESSTSGTTAQPANAAPATSLAWVSTMGPDRGKAIVSIDGGQVATVDLYSPTQTLAQVVWSINGLAPGVNHNIQIQATGTKNVSATAAKVDYDAIVGLK